MMIKMIILSVKEEEKDTKNYYWRKLFALISTHKIEITARARAQTRTQPQCQISI